MHVYRLHNEVAIVVGTGETVYMAPETAYKLADALEAFANDVKMIKAINSTIKMVIVENDYHPKPDVIPTDRELY